MRGICGSPLLWSSFSFALALVHMASNQNEEGSGSFTVLLRALFCRQLTALFRASPSCLMAPVTCSIFSTCWFHASSFCSSGEGHVLLSELEALLWAQLQTCARGSPKRMLQRLQWSQRPSEGLVSGLSGACLARLSLAGMTRPLIAGSASVVRFPSSSTLTPPSR